MNSPFFPSASMGVLLQITKVCCQHVYPFLYLLLQGTSNDQEIPETSSFHNHLCVMCIFRCVHVCVWGHMCVNLSVWIPECFLYWLLPYFIFSFWDRFSHRTWSLLIGYTWLVYCISYRNNKIKFILCPVPHKMACVLKTRFHRGWTSGDREDRTLLFIRGIQTILMQVIQSHILQLKVCFAYISLLIEPNKNRFCIIQEVDGF